MLDNTTLLTAKLTDAGYLILCKDPSVVEIRHFNMYHSSQYYQDHFFYVTLLTESGIETARYMFQSWDQKWARMAE